MTLDLLRDIEEYARTTAAEFGVDVANERSIWSYWLLSESVGEMRRETILNFRGEYLDNATESIRFHFQCEGDVGCEIDVGLQKGESELTASAWGVAAERDRAIGIAEAIKDRFSRVSNNNYLFHYHPMVGLLAVGGLLVAAAAFGNRIESSQLLQHILRAYIVTAGFVWLYLAIGSLHLPYAQFATRKNENRAARFWKLTWLFVSIPLATLVAIFRGYIWRS